MAARRYGVPMVRSSWWWVEVPTNVDVIGSEDRYYCTKEGANGSTVAPIEAGIDHPTLEKKLSVAPYGFCISGFWTPPTIS